MTSGRRFSQAISEGEGISVVAAVDDLGEAGAAEESGAEAILVRGRLRGLREATQLPILWCLHGSADDAMQGGADAYLLDAFGRDEEGELERRHGEVIGLGLECVVEVGDEEELRLVLERLDPEIILLSGARGDADEQELDHVLDLLPDIPAGKLVIVELSSMTQANVAGLERVGVDGVVVRSGDVAGLVGAAPPEV